jgi:hypothetical protein
VAEQIPYRTNTHDSWTIETRSTSTGMLRLGKIG